MQCRTLTNEWHCNYILCFFFCLQVSAVGRQSGCAVMCTNYKTPQLEDSLQPAIFRCWFYISWIWCMCFLISVSAVFWKKCGCQWCLFASLQWVNSLWRRNCWCHQYHEVQMNMKHAPEHVKAWYMLQIHWIIIWIMMMKSSTKKQQVTAWSGM